MGVVNSYQLSAISYQLNTMKIDMGSRMQMTWDWHTSPQKAW